jgi:hypothetical protein
MRAWKKMSCYVEYLEYFVIVRSFDLFEALDFYLYINQEFYRMPVVIRDVRQENPEIHGQGHDHLKFLYCSAKVDKMGI